MAPTPAAAQRRRRRFVLLMTSVLAFAGLTGACADRVQAAPASLSVTLRNETGSTAPLYAYLLGVDLTSANRDTLGYVDAAGAFHPWPDVAAGGPQAAPDVALKGPASGGSISLAIPRGMSGRLYYSVGSPLDFKLVRDDAGRSRLVQPAPWVAGDPNYQKLFDWAEFTYDNGIWINSTQVDQFALPAAVTVKGSNRENSTGQLVSGGRQQLIDTIAADSELDRSVVKDNSGRVLRVLSAGHATREGLVDPGYLDEAIDRAWSAKSTRLTIQPFENHQGAEFIGRYVGSRLVFTDASGAEVASFAKPSSLDVFECAGALVAPNDMVVGPIARTLCAALNRGTLGLGAVEPVLNTSAFYRTKPSNGYAKAVHAAMADRKAYAFAFDDVAQQESLVHDPDPISVTVTVPLIGDGRPEVAPTESPSPTATPSSSATPKPSADPSPDQDTSQVLTVDLRAGHPGYAVFTFGPGTSPGLVTVAVSGGRTSTISVDGPGSVRADLKASPGRHTVTVSGPAGLGKVSVTLP